jgi:hypothetical protein
MSRPRLQPLSARLYDQVDTVKVGYFPDREPDPPEPVVLHAVGLDLGQAQDFSALVVVEYEDTADEPVYQVGHIHRWALGTPYTQVVRDVEALLLRSPLCWRVPLVAKPEGWRQPALVVDKTGVGNAVLELFDRETLKADLHPALITSGHSSRRDESGTWHVAKVQLVSVLQAMLQSGRLKIDANLELAGTLAEELKRFKVKVTAAGHETFEAWRERDHDDIVLSLGLALFVAEHRPKGILDAYV